MFGLPEAFYCKEQSATQMGVTFIFLINYYQLLCFMNRKGEICVYQVTKKKGNMVYNHLVSEIFKKA